MAAFTKPISTSIHTLYFCILVSRHSFRQSWTLSGFTGKINALLLCSCKQIPQMKSHLPLKFVLFLINQLHTTDHHNEFISVSLFFFTYTSGLIHFITPPEFYTCADWIIQYCQNNSIQTLTNRFLHFQCLFVAQQAPVSRPLTLKSLEATYKNHSCKRSSPETDPFLPPEGVRLHPGSAVIEKWSLSN